MPNPQSGQLHTEGEDGSQTGAYPRVAIVPEGEDRAGGAFLWRTLAPLRERTPIRVPCGLRFSRLSFSTRRAHPPRRVQ